MPDTSYRRRNFGIFLLLLVSVLHFSVADRKIQAVKGHGKLGPRSSGSDERHLELRIEKQTHNLKVTRQPMKTPVKRPSKKDADVEVLETADQSVTCMEECNGTSYCSSSCLIENGTGYMYVKHNKALMVRNDEKARLLSNDLLIGIKEALDKKMESGKRLRRSRRSNSNKPTLLVPHVKGDTVLFKIRFMVDVALLERFIDFVGNNDVQAAMEEIECFLAVLLNRVNLFYRHLNELGVNFTSSDNVTYSVGFGFCIESVMFPPKNETTNEFYDIYPNTKNKRNGYLVTKVLQAENNIFSEVFGHASDFTSYLYELYEGLHQPFDLVEFITGENLLVEVYTNTSSGELVLVESIPLLGIAYIGAFCEDFSPFDKDKRFGFTAFFTSSISRILSHELGHNLGSLHDVTPECPADAYTMMAPRAPSVTADLTQYYKWSLCSVRDMANHFSKFSSERLATCFYTDKPTEEEFLQKFCKGILGQRYDLNDQCKFVYGADSYLCTDGSSDLSDGDMATENCFTENGPDGLVPLAYCANDNSCDETPNTILQIFDGTDCRNGTGRTGICFKGHCADYHLCPDSMSQSDSDDP